MERARAGAQHERERGVHQKWDGRNVRGPKCCNVWDPAHSRGLCAAYGCYSVQPYPHACHSSVCPSIEGQWTHWTNEVSSGERSMSVRLRAHAWECERAATHKT